MRYKEVEVATPRGMETTLDEKENAENETKLTLTLNTIVVELWGGPAQYDRVRVYFLNISKCQSSSISTNPDFLLPGSFWV